MTLQAAGLGGDMTHALDAGAVTWPMLNPTPNPTPYLNPNPNPNLNMTHTLDAGATGTWPTLAAEHSSAQAEAVLIAKAALGEALGWANGANGLTRLDLT